MPRYSILVPTYNEESVILETLGRIAHDLGASLSAQCEVIIADDGTDGLEKAVQAESSKFPFESVKVIRNNPAIGKGLSLARGFQAARGGIAGFLDADLSTPPRYILQAIQILEKGDVDFVVGSRRLPESEMVRDQPWIKTALGDALRYFVKVSFFGLGFRFTDTQCGFKFFRAEVAKKLYSELVSHDGMTDIEILVRSQMFQFKGSELGVQWKDTRVSKRSLSRIWAGDLKSLMRIFAVYRLKAKGAS